jgi:hypothetical protein
LFAKRLRPYRFLGISYLVSFAVIAALHGKNYYLAPIYPMLAAAGAVVIDDVIERRRLDWLKPAIAVVLLAGGAILAPIVIPVFSPENFMAYMAKLPIKPPRSEHSHERAVLPQHYAADQAFVIELQYELIEALHAGLAGGNIVAQLRQAAFLGRESARKIDVLLLTRREINFDGIDCRHESNTAPC